MDTLRDLGVGAAAVTAILTLGLLLIASFRRVLRLEMDLHFAPLRDQVRDVDARTRTIETRQRGIVAAMERQGFRPNTPNQEAP